MASYGLYCSSIGAFTKWPVFAASITRGAYLQFAYVSAFIPAVHYGHVVIEQLGSLNSAVLQVPSLAIGVVMVLALVRLLLAENIISAGIRLHNNWYLFEGCAADTHHGRDACLCANPDPEGHAR